MRSQGTTPPPSIWDRRLLAATFLALVAVAPTAAQKKLKPVYPVTEQMRVDRGLPILVPPPKVTVGSYKVGRVERQTDIAAAEIAEWIRRTEIDALQQRGFSASPADASANGPWAELVEASEGLVRRTTATEADLAVLELACGLAEGAAVLAQHLRIKGAPKGGWNPWSGGMTVGMSNSNLRGILFDCRTHERLWEGELFVRMLPELQNERFKDAVIGIFGNLSGGGH